MDKIITNVALGNCFYVYCNNILEITNQCHGHAQFASFQIMLHNHVTEKYITMFWRNSR